MQPTVSRRAILTATLAAAAFSSASAQGGPTAANDSVAAARQLEIGEQWFRSACISCHATGVLANPDFRLKWGGRSAYDLFERIRSTMPETSPGSLTQGTYAAVVAYLLTLNGMPAPSRRLSTDSMQLKSIRLSFPARTAGTRP